jgi:pimeloyl-ACP methyl ester carboxylesterase
MKLFCRKYGSGPPLIILHGLYGSSDNWVKIARKVREYYTCYLPDQRNHGRSPHSNEHNYDVMSDDLQELVEDLNLDRFFLAGHSMGGKTAINYAISHPWKLYGLLIADISPFATEDSHLTSYNLHLQILNAILKTDITRLSTRKEVDSELSASIRSEKIRGFIMKNLQRTPDNKFEWKINARALLDNLDKIMEGIGRPVNDVHQITGFPVIFLKGEKSDYLPQKDRVDIEKIFPAAELVEVKQAGHWIHADRPDEVVKMLLSLRG